MNLARATPGAGVHGMNLARPLPEAGVHGMNLARPLPEREYTARNHFRGGSSGVHRSALNHEGTRIVA